MKTKKNCLGFVDDYVPKTLDEDLVLLLEEADKLIGERMLTIEQTLDKLILINSECSNKLALDIITIKKEIDNEEDYKNYSQNQEDNPFLTLHGDDDEY